MGKVSYLFATLTLCVACPTHVAAITVIGEPDASWTFVRTNAGGGGNFVNDPFGNTPSTSITDYTDNPLSSEFIWTLDDADPNAGAADFYGTGSVYSSANLATGELKVRTEVDATGSSSSDSTRANTAYSQATFGDQIFINETITDPVTGYFTVSIDIGPTVPTTGAFDGSNTGINLSISDRTGTNNHNVNTSLGDVIPDSIVAPFTVDSSNPFFNFSLSVIALVSAVGVAGVTDLSNTLAADVTLPEGYTFASHSGVFLTEAVNPVPIPAALPLLLTALGGLGFVGWRQKRKAGRV